MSESETDIEFVSDMEWLHSHDREAALPPEKLIRLFALARRGAEAAAEVERLKAELLERDAVWLPEKDSEIERLRAELEQCQQTLYRQIGLTIGASEEATKASSAEIERLRAALREIDEIGRVAAQVPGPRNKLMEICARARAAMGGGDE